ncbi:MAG: 3-deoxy-D-manno-octulosonic acid transferase [Pirellulales bacterium]|nr:3-deoxy-D-manno-octulosonic acid transferase [Pirellulales bacterium]
MPYLLDFCYLLLILLSLPWLAKEAIRKGKYREGFGAKLLGLVPRRTSAKKCLWFHAVSVGEVNLLEPLLKKIRVQRPDWECVVSTTTKTGMALAKKKYADLTVFYCPLDFTWAAAAAMRRIRPDMLVLAELELWPNLIRAARRRGAKVAVVNGRLSEKSFRGYRRIRRLIGPSLRRIDIIAAQDETYAERFAALGADRSKIAVTGSMKYDGAETDRQNPKTRRLRELADIEEGDIVFLAGSTQEPEEAAAIDIFKHLADEFPRLKLIIVPRHPERFGEVAQLLERSGVAWRRRTALENRKRAAGFIPAPNATPPNNIPDKLTAWEIIETPMRGDKPRGSPAENNSKAPSIPRVLLVDCVGELGAWWGTAHLAFVGGSFGTRGGQNMIEPAAYGAAVAFGPNTWNFRDIVAAMRERQTAVVVNDPAELEAFVRRGLADPSYAADLGRRAQSLVKAQLGATEKTLNLLQVD